MVCEVLTGKHFHSDSVYCHRKAHGNFYFLILSLTPFWSSYFWNNFIFPQQSIQVLWEGRVSREVEDVPPRLHPLPQKQVRERSAEWADRMVARLTFQIVGNEIKRDAGAESRAFPHSDRGGLWGPTNSSLCVPETTDRRCLIFLFQIPAISHSEYKIQEHLPSVHRSCHAVGCAAHLWQGKQLLCCILLSVICFVTMRQGYTCQIAWECSDCEQSALKNARMPDICVALTLCCSWLTVLCSKCQPVLWRAKFMIYIRSLSHSHRFAACHRCQNQFFSLLELEKLK